MGIHDFLSAVFVFFAALSNHNNALDAVYELLVRGLMYLDVSICGLIIFANFRKINLRCFKSNAPTIVKKIIEIANRANTCLACTLIIGPFSYIMYCNFANFSNFANSIDLQKFSYVLAVTFAAFCIRWDQKREIRKENLGKSYNFSN